MTAVSPTSTTATARLLGIARRTVGAVDRRWRRIRLGRGCGFFRRSGELFKPSGGFEELVAVDVRVPRDGRDVGVTEVLGDESRVAELLT